MSDKIVLITGANKGIGFEIAKQLCEKGFTIIITARDKSKGLKAVETLSSTGAKVDFIQLDVTSNESIKKAAEEFGKKYSRLDVLINNAGILQDKTDILTLPMELLHITLRTNTIGIFLVIQEFLKYIPNEGRIINMSSGLGSLKSMGSQTPAYSISKTAVNAITRQFSSALLSRKIAVNSVCPGWVKTDMGGAGASREVSKGAETPVWLASEAPITLTGKFLRDKQEIDW
jgi:NAD(P)-dependent dehydrogenase (short-subunit alcohol dehydrogenase family)